MEYDHFLRQVCPLLGLKWRKYRRRSTGHRINQRITEFGLDDYASYLSRLKEDSREADGLADLMRVTVSRFFRDKACWADLTARVLPALLAEKTSGKTLAGLSVHVSETTGIGGGKRKARFRKGTGLCSWWGSFLR